MIVSSFGSSIARCCLFRQVQATTQAFEADCHIAVIAISSGSSGGNWLAFMRSSSLVR